MATLAQQITSAFTRVGADVKAILMALSGKLDSSQRGAANGVAALGPDGKVVASQLPEAVVGAMRYVGTWNAATNAPAIPTASASNQGHYYVVATAGSTTVSGITDWKVGDWLVSSGTKWDKIDSSDQVTSVAGRQGAVVLTKADVGLTNASNTSDADKPVSTAQAAAIGAKANVNSPTFTGTPSGPTPGETSNSTQFATTEFVRLLAGDPSTNFVTAYEAARNA